MTETTLKRHPVRGALFGLMLGISAAYFLYFQFAVFGFDTVGGVATRFAVIILVGVVVGVVWAYMAPPRKAKDFAPPASAGEPDAPPAPTWPEAPRAEEAPGIGETVEPEDAWRPVGTEDHATDPGEPEEA